MLAEKHKLRYLEGMRGLAAIIVVLHHYILAFYPAMSSANEAQIHNETSYFEEVMAQIPLNIFYNGGFAVCIFFILSGYVLSNNYHQNNNPKILIQYGIKRYFRLLVPVSVSILVAYAFVHLGFMNRLHLGDITKSKEWLAGSFNISDNIYPLVKNMFLDVFLFKDNTYNPVLWTMTYELLGSFLIFAFLFITHPIKYKWSLYGLLVIILFVTRNEYYAAFILGVILNKYVVQKRRESKSMNVPTWLLWLLFLIGFYLSSYPSCINIKNTIYGVLYFPWLNNEVFYHVIGSFIIMFVFVNSPKAQSALSGKILNYVGKISFSFYLLHFIILCSLSCFLFKLFFISYEYNSSVILAFLCSLPVIAIMSIGYYKWVDKAGIKLSEKIVEIFFSKTERL